MISGTVRVVIPVLAMTLMGCSSPPQLDASDSEALGGCTGGMDPFGDHLMGLGDRIRLVGGWAHLSGEQARAAVDQAQAEGPADVLMVEEPSFITGGTRDQIVLGEPAGERLRRVVHDAAQVYIGTDVQPEDPTNIIVVTDGEGRASFLGSCHHQRYTQALAAVAADMQAGTAEEVLVELIREEIELPDDYHLGPA